jgi:hypothetical protein
MSLFLLRFLSSILIANGFYKGNNLEIEVGKDETIYGYSIDTPTQIFTGENSNGETMAIWIAEATGRKTLVKFS